MRGLARFAVGTPAGLLLVVWTFALGLFAFGPVHYNQPPRVETWLFLAGCLVLFCSAAWFGEHPINRRASSSSVRAPDRVDARRVESIVRVAAVVGLFGALCIVVDKVVLSGLDFSQGVTAVRFSREQAVSEGTALALPRSPLLYIGYVTFCFSVAAYLLYLLRGEALRRSTGLLAFAGLASPFSFSLVYGGRSPLFLVLGISLGAIAVRLLSGERAMPRGKTAPFLFLVFVGLTFVYSTWVLSERFVATGATDYASIEQRFVTTYDAHVDPVGATAVPGASPAPSSTSVPLPTESPASKDAAPLLEQAQMHAVVDSFYFSHELPMLDRTLAYSGSLGPYYGAYQFYLGAAFIERVVPSWNVDAVMIPQLKAANVYGWFSTAWGGMYLDFGAIGALVGVLFCGWLAGRVFRGALVNRTDGSRLLMCYVVAGILATPVLSIFTISISLPILAALLITAYFLRPNHILPVWFRLPRRTPLPVR